MSGSLLGFLRVNLAMDSAQFGAGARQARGELAAIGAAARAAGAAVAAGAAGLSAWATSSAEAAAELQDLARAGKASLGEFQRMAAGAKTVGVESDKLGDILKDVQDKLGDFLAGEGGELLDFFDLVAPKAGVTAAQFAQLSGPEALQLYVSSLEAANLGHEEMVFYMEAIANDAALLLPLLQNNGAELDRIAASTSRYGGLTEGAAAAGREMREAQVQIGAAMRSLGDALASSGLVEAIASMTRASADFIGLQLAPAIRAIGAGLREAFAETAPLGRALAVVGAELDRLASYAATLAALLVGRFAAGLAAAAAGLALTALRAATLTGVMGGLRAAILRTGIGALAIGLGEVAHQFLEGYRATGTFSGGIARLGEIWAEIRERMGFGVMALEMEFTAAADAVRAAWFTALYALASRFSGFVQARAAEINAVLEAVGSSRRVLGEFMAGTTAELRDAALKHATLAENARDIAHTLAGMAGAPLESLRAVEQGATAVADATSGAGAAAARLSEALADLGGGGGGGGKGGGKTKTGDGPLFRLKDDLREGRTLTEDLQSTLTSGFSGAFDGLISGTQSARGALASLAQDLARMAANRLITQLLGAAFGAVGGGGFAPVAGFSGFAPGGLYADGTSFAPGGMAVVGERGPELVNLPRGAEVIPNHRLDAAPGGGAAEPAPVQIVNLWDRKNIGDYLQSPDGRRILVNEVGRIQR